MLEENKMEMTGTAVDDYPRGNAGRGDFAINQITQAKQQGRSSDGDWFVLQHELKLIFKRGK